MDDHAGARRVTGAWERVTGRARFAADVSAPGVLHAAFARSTEPHALLREVDVGAAARLPGVVAVLTGADVTPWRFGRKVRDLPVLADGRVLFVGQPVAVVAADDPDTARRAAALVRVAYEPLPALLDAHAALAPDAVVLHPDYDDYDGALPSRPGPNVQGVAEFGAPVGDVLAACDEVREDTFTWDRSHALPLEPHACLVIASADRVEVFASHKEPYKLRADLAALTGLPEASVIVHPVSIGGDFGAKGTPLVEAACCLLAQATRRPVRGVLPYRDELAATSARHPGRMRLRTGLRDGRLVAHDTDTLLEGGAFTAFKPMPKQVVSIAGRSMTPYDVEQRHELVTAVYTNTLPGGHVRSPGEYQSWFAGESHMDLLARAHGEDPIAFRLRHATAPAARTILERLRDVVSGWRAELGADEGVGVSVFHAFPGPGHSNAEITATRDGVEVRVALADQGGGGPETLRRLSARRLGVPLERVRLRIVSTASELRDAGTGASRVTAVAGTACVRACEALLTELGLDPSASDPASDGPAGDAADRIARRLAALGRDSVTAHGSCEVGRDQVGAAELHSHAGLALHVAVDRDTGVWRVRRALLVADTGEVVHPVGHRGQLEGGFVYGLGQAGLEWLRSEDGRIASDSLASYKIPSMLDVPPLDVELLPPGGRGPLSVGELTNVGVPAAVANAIHDAVGVRIRALPITAERVWRALQDAEVTDPAMA